MYATLADLILLVHVLFAAYNVFGLILIWLGAAVGWGWVRGCWFRGTHLATMGIVVVESLLGMVCPLTKWESRLRLLSGGGEYEKSFMHHWAEKFFYYDVSSQTFMLIYIAFFVAMLGTLWLVPVEWRGKSRA